MPWEERSALPDSIIVRTQHGKLLMRSDAAIYVLERLGGMWRVIAFPMSLVPRAVRDTVYDFIARIRHRLCARPDTVCPILPVDLRARFQP